MLLRGLFGLARFAVAAARSGRKEVVIRVNSFSVSGEKDDRLVFTNKNLQDIYDAALEKNTKCIVIVADLREYPLRQKISAAILYPQIILPLVSKILYRFNKRAIDELVDTFSVSVPISKEELKTIVSHQIAGLHLWSGIYKYIRPSVVYYESPHNAFESEIAAAKLNRVKTVEIYHGALSANEPSYSQKHLDFDGLTHSVCEEFLSQSKEETRLISAIGKYEKVTTLAYKSNLSLSLRQRLKLSRVRHRPARAGRKISFITSITDNDLSDVTRYIRRNRRHLLETFQEVSLHLHPADSRERWESLRRAYGFVHFSTLPLSEAIASSHALVVVSPTTVLQLRALEIEFVDLTRKVI